MRYMSLRELLVQVLVLVLIPVLILLVTVVAVVGLGYIVLTEWGKKFGRTISSFAR